VAFVIGIDTGGTFTDGFLADQAGRSLAAKSPSTPPDFSVGFLDVLEELARGLNTSSRELLADTLYIVHGTTSTLNAVVTGDVAKVGFLTTRGHVDSILIMNQEGRYAGLDPAEIQNMPRTNKPPPLVPRERILEITERVDYKGSVVVPLDEASVRRAVRKLLERHVEAIAISFLWSFQNPSHERRARQIVREEAPDLYVAISSEVSPRIREYSRSATTIISTQVGPVLQNYLVPLERALRERGFKGSLLIMQGSGGCVRASDAPAHAVSTLGSVLTGGVVGCMRFAEALGHRNIISTDIGGTTFLVGLVIDNKPVTTTRTILHQHQINTPMVDVHTIGAGGGAVAWLDQGHNLRVGPRSAGARPGPACYGEGGTQPTVTDADLVLGILNPDNFLGGRKKLDRTLAEAALREHIAQPLGLTVDDAAAAIYSIQNAQTADLVRKVVVGTGRDPRDFVLYSFGGAGPVHCAGYCAELGVGEIIIPLGSTAAVFSAYGLAASDIVLTAEASRPENFPADPERVSAIYAQLEDELRQRMQEQGLQFAGAVVFQREADIRYTLQLTEVATPVPNSQLTVSVMEQVGRDFERLYEDLYGKGSGFADAGMQLITYRVRATGALPIRPKLQELPPTRQSLRPVGTRKVFLDVRHRWQEAAIYDARTLPIAAIITGPAVVEAPTTTVAIPEGCTATVDRFGNLSLRFSSPAKQG
jgi:N-methylhydantoinase A